jgi:hypothetical protein
VQRHHRGETLVKSSDHVQHDPQDRRAATSTELTSKSGRRSDQQSESDMSGATATPKPQEASQLAFSTGKPAHASTAASGPAFQAETDLPREMHADRPLHGGRANKDSLVQAPCSATPLTQQADMRPSDHARVAENSGHVLEQPVARPMTAKKPPPLSDDSTVARQSRLRPPEQPLKARSTKDVQLYPEGCDVPDDEPITIIQEGVVQLVSTSNMPGALVSDIVEAKQAADEAAGVHLRTPASALSPEQGILLERTKRSRLASAPRTDLMHARESVQHVVQHVVALVRCMDYLQAWNHSRMLAFGVSDKCTCLLSDPVCV